VDYALLLVELPKVVNALLAVVCDVYVLKLAGLLYGAKAGGLALLCNVSSWFLFYCLPRSMANSLETVLTAPLLYHWYMSVDHALPQARRRHTAVYLTLSSVAALVRPTAVIVSAPLVLSHLYKRPRQWRMLLKYSIAIGVIALLWSLAVDWYFYEQPVFVQWNFFVFNVLEGQSAIYGTHPWHWYITQGVPVVLSTSLPTLGLLLCLRPAQSVWGLVSLGGWVVVAHSLLAHKENRFIMPVVPIASILAGEIIVKPLYLT
jgi:phosphatidylinositol glycan class B